MRRLPLAVSGMLALAAVTLGGCSAGRVEPRRPAGQGRVTIVSLNPCTDAILAQVARPGQLLAISHFSHDPASSSMDLAQARRFAETSGSVEEVAALAPDVVVASTYLAPATHQALTNLGMRVVTMPIPSDISESEAQVRELAKLTGNLEAGKVLIDHIEQAVSASAPPAGTSAASALVWESGGIVAGDNTLIADLLAHTGFTNGAAARGLSQADFLPLERVIAQPPRVIFAVGNPRSQEDRMLRHPALRALPGTVRAPLDGALLWCGGPTIPRALARLAQVRRELTR